MKKFVEAGRKIRKAQIFDQLIYNKTLILFGALCEQLLMRC